MPRLRVKVSDRPHHHGPKPRAVIVSDRGRRLELPFAPVEATIDGVAPTWSTIARTGRRPLLLDSGGQLKTWHGSIVLAHPDWHRSVQPMIDRLERIAADGDAITFHYAGPERGRWRITSCPIDVVLRTPRDQPARAVVDLTLTRASDVAARVGPLSGGAKRPDKKRGGGGGHHDDDRPHPGAPKTYTVRQGDTLAAIAQRVYGDPDDWHRIADANGIRDPRKLKVGQKLRIP